LCSAQSAGLKNGENVTSCNHHNKRGQQHKQSKIFHSSVISHFFVFLFGGVVCGCWKGNKRKTKILRVASPKDSKLSKRLMGGMKAKSYRDIMLIKRKKNWEQTIKETTDTSTWETGSHHQHAGSKQSKKQVSVALGR
jgi:hypothetical protein